MPNGFGSWGHPLNVVAAAVRDAVWSASARTLTHVGVLQAIASNTIRLEVPARSQWATGQTWTVLRSARVVYPGTYRVTWEHGANMGTASTKTGIRLNGGAILAEWSQSGQGPTSRTYDLTALPGDVIEVCGMADYQSVYITNFRVRCDYQYMVTPTYNPAQEV